MIYFRLHSNIFFLCAVTHSKETHFTCHISSTVYDGVSLRIGTSTYLTALTEMAREHASVSLMSGTLRGVLNQFVSYQ